ncbi:MAG: MogA/MoaB family molybdenum cofactor biosynthesis protein [Acidobacteriota bacterium]
MSVEQHRQQAASELGFSGITVSSSRTAADDRGGELLRRLITESGHRWCGGEIVGDEVAAIRAAVSRCLAASEVDVVVLTGGTGFSPADLTVEAVTPLFERPVEGFGEIFRALSFEQVGAAAMLSRSTAGLVQGKAIFALPGSPKAVALALERLILPESAHLLAQARRVR